MNSTTTLHKTIFKKFEQICPNTTKNQCSCIIYETGGYLIPIEIFQEKNACVTFANCLLKMRNNLYCIVQNMTNVD